MRRRCAWPQLVGSVRVQLLAEADDQLRGGVVAEGSDVGIAVFAIERDRLDLWLAGGEDHRRRAVLGRVGFEVREDGLGQASPAIIPHRCAASNSTFAPTSSAISRIVDTGCGVRLRLPPMVINCGGPSFNLSPEFLLNEVRPRFLDMVARIESALHR